MIRPKASRLLEYLLEGHPVPIPGSSQPLEIGEKDDGTPVVGFRVTIQRPGEPREEAVANYDITLNDFLALAAHMSDDDLFVMGAERALTHMGHEHAETRERRVKAHRET